MENSRDSKARSPSRTVFTRVLRIAVAVALTGGILEIGWASGMNGASVSIILLLAILVFAAQWGMPAALFACISGIIGLDYLFLPPDGFGISDPREWIMMGAFILTAIIGGSLSSRAHQRTIEAMDSREEMEKLNRLSRAIMVADTNREMIRRVPELVRDIFEFHEVAIHVFNSGETFGSNGADTALSLRLPGTGREDSADSAIPSMSFLPLKFGGIPLGSIGFGGQQCTDALRRSIADVVAVLIRISWEQEEERRAADARTALELKSALVGSLVHELKTPLTSIKAVISCLLSQSETISGEDRHLLRIAQEETERLDRVAGSLLNQSFRNDAPLAKYPLDPGDVILAAVEQLDPVRARRISVLESPLNSVRPAEMDPALIEQVLIQILENALKFSEPESPVIVSTALSGNDVVIHIADSGKGVSEEEQVRIFEKAYRSPQHESIEGSGMGLAIAKRIMDLHGGEIWVTNQHGEGSVFHISLPAAEASVLD